MTTRDFLILFTERLHEQYAAAIQDLRDEQLYFQINDQTCHIAFHTWHFLRSEDNILNFVCQNRKPTLWMRQDLHTQWGLPLVEQGTGMEGEEARALHVPSAAALAQYGRDLAADVMPYLKDISDEELQRGVKLAQWPEVPILQRIGLSLIEHGNGHLGQIYTMRAAQGLSGDAF